MKSWEDKLLNTLSEYFHGGLNISFWRSCRISRVSFFHITPSSFTQSLRLLKPKPNIQTSKFLNLIFGELESTESRLLTWSSLQTDVMIDKMNTHMDSVGKVVTCSTKNLFPIGPKNLSNIGSTEALGKRWGW